MLPIMYAALIDEKADKSSFEKFYEAYKNKAFMVAMDLLNDRMLAEDCVSDTFLSIARNFQTVNKLEPNKQLKYVVISIRNTAKDMLKKQKADRDAAEYDDETYFTEKSYSEYSLLEWKDCFQKLNQTDKDVLYLRCILQLEYKEISKALGISQGAARARVFAARSNLKKLLEEEDSL